MKKLLLLSFVLSSFGAAAQTAFWSEDFSTGCNQGALASSYTGPNGAWTITSTGTNDSYANTWFVSATEAFTGTNNCGDGCLNNASLTNGTLHVSNVAVALANIPADNGASYNTGGVCQSFAICVNTNKRVESPSINCTGKTGISISFSYFEDGDGTNDNATVWYYDGITWTLLSDPQKTTTMCSPQGTWTSMQLGLPASADLNPNVKIGFQWTNNDDGVGTDPSFAVDSIRVMSTIATGIASAIPHYEVKVLYSNDNIIIDCDQPVTLTAVRDLLGREVKSELHGNTLIVDAAKGAYMAELNVNGQRIFKKVIAGN